MWPYLIAAGSTLLSMNAKAKAGEAEAEAGAQDLMDSALSGHFREKGLQEKWSRTSGTMRARTAASGVAMAGSALEVLQNSAGQAARDLYIARHISQRAGDSARRRMEGGERMQRDAVLEGILGLAKTTTGALKDSAGRYKPPDRISGGVTEESWMPEYGND